MDSALIPLCDDAGIGGPWDVSAATLLDSVLLGTPEEVDAALRQVRVDRRILLAHHASVRVLKRRSYFEATQSVTLTADWASARKYEGV